MENYFLKLLLKLLLKVTVTLYQVEKEISYRYYNSY